MSGQTKKPGVMWNWWQTALLFLFLIIAVLLLMVVIGMQKIISLEQLSLFSGIAGGFATVFGVTIAIIAAFFAYGQVQELRNQVELSRRVAEAEFLNHLDETFRDHSDVHMKLWPGGEWSRRSWKGPTHANPGPEGPADWASVESYMGIFERVHILLQLQNGFLTKDIIRKLYGYRIINIVANDKIYKEKILDRGASWTDFIELWRELYPDDPRLPNRMANNTEAKAKNNGAK